MRTVRAVRRGPGALAACALVLILAPLASALDEEYHDMQETYDAMLAAATSYPSICRMDTVGYSTEDGLPIWSLKMSDNVDVDEDEPARDDAWNQFHFKHTGKRG